ncbi:NAD(P)-binding oxidoreductase [Priestia flexa]|uniref:NAD(P)-binding oxidoreductase n=1 Tax=Priestia flexa TaxID=86664 RepID=A0ABU4JBQ1_9BACI|nr:MULTISPECIES: NAD(P)-binding oxidoreductase [Bacillaceae]AQX54419.1 oxidoreductase [Priestia flexa]KZB91767.1 oxidoreductase [Bacillus sp. VT 712]MBY6085470.1 SDR family oxidoreductase [Priestia flexa]MCA1203003.1 SDR family oxidoreductase [Priestia flexa]MCG7314538.1 SDR family oxidoreductase [Priestia flexa]
MKFVVFGASGRTGQAFVNQALEEGHFVTAFVRTPDKLTITNSNLHIIEGNVTDSFQVAHAITGHDAVVSCLGTDGLGPSTFLEEATSTIIKAMQEQGLHRILYTASAGIEGEIPGMTGWLAQNILKNPLRDHLKAVQLLKTSNLHWTVARPMGLTNGPVTAQYRKAVTGVPEDSKNISRADVAHFLLHAANAEIHLKQSVALSY